MQCHYNSPKPHCTTWRQCHLGFDGIICTHHHVQLTAAAARLKRDCKQRRRDLCSDPQRPPTPSRSCLLTMGHSWRDRRTESNSAPTSPGEPTPPTKKIKTRTEIDPDAWASWKYPPKFWERLSKIWLTHRAVEEHNRRTRLRRRPPSPPSPGLRELAQHPVPTVTTNARDFFRFARHGGPDLSDLRGVSLR